ncbi:MAG: DUF262 domain-containing protein [Bacteroides sp.]|nr:DUF262 domain-containing protein [Bacteroides sp.]
MKTTTLKNLISENNPYGIRGILIPRIQRAYAQGRNDTHAVKTRERFLSAIHSGLVGNGLTLDFIYGNIQNGQLIPLDGQQRLTTLWLLHWYANKKEDINDSCLSRFSYNTRYSARDFIAKLVKFKPTWKICLSDEIRNQGWFPMEWINDPTVGGMLTMLDEIQRRFADIDDLWTKLDKINFYFRDIEDMKLTDDIYIKMNSRGKPLTDFEHFKAEFLKIIRTDNNDEDLAKRIGLKVDREWTDLLWNYRDKDNLVDNGFLNFFRMISLILIYKADQSASEYNLMDDFKLLERLYRNKPENVAFLEQAFDCMVDILNKSRHVNQESQDFIADFFGSYLSIGHHQPEKVVVPQQIIDVNIFKIILEGAALQKNTPYWVIMIYTFLLYLMNSEKVLEMDFRRRLRIVVNLLKNSRNEVVDNPNGDAGNRMPANLCQVENIILCGEIADSIMIDGDVRPNFNVIQMEEERQKLQFTQEHPEHSVGLFELEDDPLIEGRTDIVGYENTHLYQRFINLFDNCSYDAIDRAMLAINDYSQRINHWCIQMGSGNDTEIGNKAWYSLFHPTGKNPDFSKTKKALRNLLEVNLEIDDNYLQEKISAYIEECREQNVYDWRYYYIVYPCFRPNRYGKYTMYADQPYTLVALYSEKRESSNAYQCMLQALIDNRAMADSWYDTRDLSYRKGRLTCENDAFVSYSLKDDQVRAIFKIPQNADCVDTIDRIQYFKEHRKEATFWVIPEK